MCEWFKYFGGRFFEVFSPLGAMPGVFFCAMRSVICMSSRGGARNRSGPAVDPSSGRSERRALSFQALPNEGYAGDIPGFPLPDADAREVEVWEASWRTPQAAAWALESWRWQVLAEYCRIVAAIEQEPKAALVAQLHRYRDQLGLTPAGMRENGWAIAQPEVAAEPSRVADRKEAPQRRMRAVRSEPA